MDKFVYIIAGIGLACACASLTLSILLFMGVIP